MSLFKPLFPKLGIEQEKISESKDYLKKKEEKDNKANFIILSVIGIVAAYLIALKFAWLITNVLLTISQLEY